jgi:hypothetical protein
MNCRRLAVVLGAVAAFVAMVNVAPARAHHSFAAEFDAEKPVTVTIRGFHARDANANAGAGRELILADGREIAIGPSVGPGR